MIIFNGPLHFPAPWSNLSRFSSGTETGRSHELLGTHSGTRSQAAHNSPGQISQSTHYQTTYSLSNQLLSPLEPRSPSEVTRDLFSTLPAIAIRRSQEPLSFRNPNKDFLSSQTLGGDSRTKREPQIPHLPVSLCDKATTRVSNLQSDKSHQDSRGDGWCTLAAHGTAFCFLGELLCLTLADRVTLPPFPPEMSYLRLLRLATSRGSQGSWRGIWHQADSVHTLGRTTSSITAPQRWCHWDY